MSTSSRPWWSRLGVCALLLAGATVITALFDRVADPTPLSLYYLAVLLAAWYGGLAFGLLASVAAVMLMDYAFVAPRGSVSVSWDDVPRLLVFVAVSIIASLLIGQRSRARRELSQQQAELHRVVDAVPAFIAAIGPDLRYRHVNAMYEQWLGKPREQLIGQHLRNVLGEKYFQKLQPTLQKVLAGEAASQEVAYPFPARGTRHMSVQYAPARLPDGRVEGFYVIATDITDRIEREEQERQASQRIANILESLSDCFVSLDHQWRFTYVNRSFESYSSRSRENLLGEEIWACFPHLSGTAIEVGLRRCADQRQPVQIEALSPTRGRWIDLRALPAEDGINIYFSDCTARRRRQLRLSLLSELSRAAQSLDMAQSLRAVCQAVVPDLADMAFVDVLGENGRVERMAAVHADAADQPLLDEARSMAPRLEDQGAPTAHVLREGAPVLYEQITPELIREKSRSEAHRQLAEKLEVSSAMAVPLMARGKVWGAWALAYGPSGRQYSADDLQLVQELAAHAALAVDNALLFQEAETARERAESANRAKDHFLAVLSHELRTPLTPVLASTQLLARSLRPDAPEQETLSIIRRNVELEARLIDDLLDLTRIARGKLDLALQPLDLPEVLADVAAICRAELAHKELEMVMPEPDGTGVQGDPARLRQVFWNLLKNAIKFTPRGGRIEVTVQPLRAEARVRVSIRDNGAGIEPGTLPTIFDAFEQGPREGVGHEGGLGLGLAICRSIVDLHDGTITAHSDGRGRGATFTVELPMAQVPVAPTNGSPTHQSHSSDGSTLSILLVEDHPDTARIMSRLLGSLGHQVRTAGSVTEAMAASRSERFDLLISDLGLPDGSGTDLMRQLIQQRPIKAIALSGYGMEEDVRRSLEAGFAEHLTKPIDFLRLEAAISRVTGSGSVADRIR